MTKADFPQFDYRALLHAREIEVTDARGAVKRYQVVNDWDTASHLVDVVECLDASQPIDAPDERRLPILWIPSPAVVAVRPLGAPLERPNHGGHPELLLAFPTIDEVFAGKPRRFLVD